MEFLKSALDFFMHLDDHLKSMILEYGTYIYVIMFIIIFVETGLVVMPFLPGDSLLFAAGTFAALGDMNIALLLIVCLVAAVLGDTVNYWLGKSVGLKVLHWKIGGRQLVKEKYIDKTHAFYDKYGPKTIILARFVPFVRTFAPFVAGIGTMDYRKFLSYNLIGAFIWVVGVTLIGYFLGNIPVVKNNFEFVILGIIFISVVPMIIELIRGMRQSKKTT